MLRTHLGRLMWAVLLASGPSRATEAEDCNGNGIEDTLEVGTARPGFSVRREIPTGALTKIVTLGDFDGDGGADILAQSLSSSELLVFLGKHAELFGAPVKMPFGGSLDSFAVGDLNGDQALDLAFVKDFAVGVLLSSGGGRLEPGGDLPIGSRPTAVAVADLNGDGTADIVTANFIFGFPESNVSVALNEGGGRLSILRNYAAGPGSTAVFAPLDIDGDGDLDLAFSKTEGGRITVLLNNGSGGFTAPGASMDLGENSAAASLRSGDVDADGRDDLLAAYGVDVRVLFSGEGSAFTRSTVFSFPGLVTGAVLFQADGAEGLDLAVATSSCEGNSNLTSVELLLHRGGERFESGWAVGPSQHTALQRGDFDGDGSLDIALFGLGGVTFFLEGPMVPIEDCDRDGVPDECEADCDQSGKADACEIALGEREDCNGNGLIDSCEGTDWNQNGIPDDCDTRDGASADCDRNGIPDEVDLAPRVSFFPGREYAVRGYSALMGDVDGDGDVDVVAYGDSVTLLVNRGDGFLGYRPLGFTLPKSYVGTLDDLDGDGNLDLVLEGKDRASCLVEEFGFVAYVNKKPGGFRKVQALPGSSFSWSLVSAGRGGLEILDTWRIAGGRFDAADIDGDALPDLVVNGIGGIFVLQSGTLQPRSVDKDGDRIPDSCQGVRFRRADWNQDGRLDLTDAVALLQFLFQEGDELTCRKAGDANADGALDITDSIWILRYLYQGGPGPPEPFPQCGLASSRGGLSCNRFAACE